MFPFRLKNKIELLLGTKQFPGDLGKTSDAFQRQGIVSLGSCVIVLSRSCPDENVNFFLYTTENPEVPEFIRVGIDNYSNISASAFNPRLPTKVIVHGYNSDMYLKALIEIRKRK